MTLDTVTIRSLLTKASDALWAIAGTDRQIVRKASEPVIPWVRSSPGWPIRYHRSYPKTQNGAAPKREKRIPEYLEADEINAIIRAAPSPKAKLLMLGQWRAGLRVSEALDLEVRDLSHWLGHSSIQTKVIYLALVPDPTGSLATVP